MSDDRQCAYPGCKFFATDYGPYCTDHDTQQRGSGFVSQKADDEPLKEYFFVRVPDDKELHYMDVMSVCLARLGNREAQIRVLRWLGERYGIKPQQVCRFSSDD